MKITREQATEILKYQLAHPEYKCPFEVMCKEVDQDNREEDDEDFVGLVPEDLDEEDKDLPEWYQTFELWLNDTSIPENQEATVIANAFTHMDLFLFVSEPKDLKELLKEYSDALSQYKEAVTDIDFIGEWKAGTETETFERGYVRGLEKAINKVYKLSLCANPETEWE